jgi:DNA-binding MarR family transcriptional regulator
MSTDEEALNAAGEALYWLSAAVIRSVAQPTRIGLTSLSTLSAVSRGGPQRITELAAQQSVSQPSMTAVISGLEQAGLVARAPDPTDGRAVLVSATDAGERFLADRRRVMAEQIAALARQMPDEDAAALTAAVPALVRLRALQESSIQSSAAAALKRR